MMLTVASGQSEPVSELQLKAAFLYNFAKFVEWPANSLPKPTTQFQICILGSEALRDELRIIAQQKTVGEHKLLVRNVPSADTAKGCHILFLSSAGRKQRARIPEDLRSILTVSDAEGFVERGGMIGLVMHDGKMQFEMNHKAATREGLVVSARLLNLARVIIE